MILQDERAFWGDALKFRGCGRGPIDGGIVLNQHTIVQNGE